MPRLALFAVACTAALAQDATFRPRRLEDIEAILRVLADYGRFLDARDFAFYARLFARDGEWIGGFGSVKGPGETQKFMERQIPGPNRTK